LILTIIINDELDVKFEVHSETGSFNVVAFLLGSIRAKAEDGLFLGQSDSVNKWPLHMEKQIIRISVSLMSSNFGDPGN
jgi:hypothetical protein